MRIGRLVSHACAQPAVFDCAACARPMCRGHRSRSMADRCAQCAGEYAPPKAKVEVSDDELFAFTDDEVAAFAPHREAARPLYDS
jgi:hypothetical protein